jgi:hypothetical protein
VVAGGVTTDAQPTVMSCRSLAVRCHAICDICCPNSLLALVASVCAPAEPDLYSLPLQSGDDFLIVATDGLFQDLSSQEAVDYAAAYFQQQREQQANSSGSSSSGSGSSGLASLWSGWLPRFMRSSPPASAHSPPERLSSVWWPSCSSFLVSRALLHASEKHIGRKPTDADNLTWIAQLPIGERRNVHDDCTVVVIHLAHTEAGHGSTAAVQSSEVVQAQSQIQSKL